MSIHNNQTNVGKNKYTTMKKNLRCVQCMRQYTSNISLVMFCITFPIISVNYLLTNMHFFLRHTLLIRKPIWVSDGDLSISGVGVS